MPSCDALTLRTGTILLRLIAAALRGEPCGPLPEDTDWDALQALSAKHNVNGIVAHALRQADGVPEQTRAFYEEALMRACLKEAVLQVEIPALLEKLEQAGVRHMVLKGYVMRRYYPDATMRSMGDVDILVGSDLPQASPVIAAQGFRLTGEAFLHDSYTKNGSLHVELHKSLMDESLTDFYAYFGEGFALAHLADGCRFRYEMSTEDFYIFLLAHLAKHFRICGTGIRSLMDVYVYRRQFPQMDKAYLRQAFDRLGLRVFAEKMETLSDAWFGGSFDGTFDAVGDYILSAGVFGTGDNHELNAFLLSTTRSDYRRHKIKYILRTIFPGRAYLGARYPAVQKHAILVPVFWVVRWIQTLRDSRYSIRYRLKGVTETDADALKKFEDTGLN